MVIKAFDYRRQLEAIEKEIYGAVKKVLNSGKLILGSEVDNLEKSFSAMVGKKYGIGVNSGTDAIKIGLRAVGVEAGDEIVTVPNTAVPTISAIRELGANPVFVDVKDDYTINEEFIEKAITKKTKAILPVHLYGQVCNMTKILDIAKKYKIVVVEDCAQAHGSKYKNKSAGSFGIVSCFSFYPTKNLGAYGDGGMILTSSKKIANSCRRLRMYGMKKGYYADDEGFNSRLDEIQAGILNVKLTYLEKWNNQRQEIAKKYLQQITNPAITLPAVENISNHCFHQFVVRVKKREKFLEYLNQSGIGWGIHYPYPIHLQKAYILLGYKKFDFPITEKFSKQIVSLPIFPELTSEEVKYIIKRINEYEI